MYYESQSFLCLSTSLCQHQYHCLLACCWTVPDQINVLCVLQQKGKTILRARKNNSVQENIIHSELFQCFTQMVTIGSPCFCWHSQTETDMHNRKTIMVVRSFSFCIVASNLISHYTIIVLFSNPVQKNQQKEGN